MIQMGNFIVAVSGIVWKDAQIFKRLDSQGKVRNQQECWFWLKWQVLPSFIQYSV